MKKALSLLLVLVLALGMSSVAFAATWVGGVAPGTGAVNIGTTAAAHDATWESDFTTGGGVFQNTVRPGDVLRIYLDEAYFVNNAGVPLTGTAGITKAEVNAMKIKPRIKVAKGSNIIDSYKIDYASGQAYFKVEFIDPFVSTGDLDFEFTAYLTLDGKSYVDVGADFSGTFENYTVDNIDKDTDYVDLVDGRVVEADEYNAKVEYDLGNGISIFGKAFKGKKYYGYSTSDLTDAQADTVDKYDIDQVYNIKQIGLAAVSSYVTLDADKGLYVYDSNLKYLGRGNEELPFSDTYYLASKQLDVDDDDEPEDEDEDEDDDIAAPPVTGGDSDISSNVNDNPSTGK